MKSAIVRSRLVAWFALIGLLLSGCVATTTRNIDKFQRGSGELKVLLMPLDVELSELGAGGFVEPKADWTEAANKHLTASIRAVFDNRSARLVSYTAPSSGGTGEAPDVQLIKLHGAVGKTILQNQFRPLPTKENRFDWTLGDGARRLKQLSGADYALFVYVRDSYSSDGRTALIVVGVLLGVGISGGQQVGFASLVNLNTGNIVWFNKLVRGVGDLRTAPAAAETADVLLENLPK